MIMIEKLMIAITHGVGPRKRVSPSSRRSAGDAKSQRHHRAPSGGGLRSIPVGSTTRAILQPDQVGARRRADETDVVGRDHHRRAQPVERGEQVQQSLRHLGVDIAGRLVGDQQLRAD